MSSTSKKGKGGKAKSSIQIGKKEGSQSKVIETLLKKLQKEMKTLGTLSGCGTLEAFLESQKAKGGPAPPAGTTTIVRQSSGGVPKAGTGYAGDESGDWYGDYGTESKTMKDSQTKKHQEEMTEKLKTALTSIHATLAEILHEVSTPSEIEATETVIRKSPLLPHLEQSMRGVSWIELEGSVVRQKALSAAMEICAVLSECKKQSISSLLTCVAGSGGSVEAAVAKISAQAKIIAKDGENSSFKSMCQQIITLHTKMKDLKMKSKKKKKKKKSKSSTDPDEMPSGPALTLSRQVSSSDPTPGGEAGQELNAKTSEALLNLMLLVEKHTVWAKKKSKGKKKEVSAAFDEQLNEGGRVAEGLYASSSLQQALDKLNKLISSRDIARTCLGPAFPIKLDSKTEGNETAVLIGLHEKLLSDHRLKMLEKLPQPSKSNESGAHKYNIEAKLLGSATRRLAMEFHSLRTDLPFHFQSSAFLRVLESNLSRIQLMLMPHPDTPYGYGCFLFDILTTPDYPHCAPSVTTLTTGKGSVRFNPNLYNQGKVCLSLLGTWEGADEESWTDQSTLLQLIVSIQSLIFVEWPHYNEPGEEGYSNKPAAQSYNSNIRTKTVQWAMIDVLKNPPKAFEYVLKVHFYTHRHAILAMLDRWSKDGVSKGTDLEQLQKFTVELKGMLEELELPEPPAPEEDSDDEFSD